MRLPKLGFNNINRVEYQVFNLDQLKDLSDKYGVNQFTVEGMYNMGLCKSSAKIKVLGRGEAKQGLVIKVHACSQIATEKFRLQVVLLISFNLNHEKFIETLKIFEYKRA